MARDTVFENVSGPQKHQAVALRSASDFSLFHRCSFVGYQDTLYAHSLRQFYRDRHIVGTVDFIFGDTSSVFQSSLILPRQPNPNPTRKIPSPPKAELTPTKTLAIYLFGSALKGLLDDHGYEVETWGFVMQEGWLEWTEGIEPPATIFYQEFENYGEGAGVEKRVKWEGYRSEISKGEVDAFGVDSYILGSEWLPGAGVEFNGSV